MNLAHTWGIGIPFNWPQPLELAAGLVLVVVLIIGIGAWLEYRSGLERTR